MIMERVNDLEIVMILGDSDDSNGDGYSNDFRDSDDFGDSNDIGDSNDFGSQ